MTHDSADFIAKLRQIEEQAHSVSAEISPGLSRSRLQHIVILAMTLRGRLEFGPAAIVRFDAAAAQAAQPEVPA
jgi:hypothetical protein